MYAGTDSRKQQADGRTNYVANGPLNSPEGLAATALAATPATASPIVSPATRPDRLRS